MQIAILGATSEIAKDLVLSMSKFEEFKISLYARDTSMLQGWLIKNNIENQYEVCNINSFNYYEKYEAIINFIGVGNPAKTSQMGDAIYEITRKYDDIALSYIEKHPGTKYIFLSSGAVYGSIFFEGPADINKKINIDINTIGKEDYYGLAKLSAELKHRSMPGLNIIDLRVFNYFSSTQDMESRFLVMDIARAIKNKLEFKTDEEDIVRDYLGPEDFFNMVKCILKVEQINTALDCYTLEPINKLHMLAEFRKIYNLNYLIVKNNFPSIGTGSKKYYYSKNKMALNLGYIPSMSSMDNLKKEMDLILRRNTGD